MNRSRVRKKIESLLGGCRFCHTTNPNLLDEHHIHFRSQGGSDTQFNRVVACSNCHRKIHAGEIIVDTWFPTSTGWRLHCWVDGVEDYL